MKSSRFKPVLLSAILFHFFSLHAQQKVSGLPFPVSPKNWTESPFEQKVFVENKGQLDNDILFSASTHGVDIYFSATGVTYRHDKKVMLHKNDEEEREREREREREKEKKGEREESEHVKYKLVPEKLEIEWLGANPNTKIEAEQKVKFYYTYPQGVDKVGKTIVANAFSKITYRDLYPGIDVEYILPDGEQGMKGGVKYSLIVHPGADVSKVKMKYTHAESMSIDPEGNLIIKSKFGEFVDHAPKTFYQKINLEIGSKYVLKNNTVSFQLESFVSTQTIVVDPWTNTPPFPFYDASYDINFDNNGNVFVYGSLTPLKEAKFDNTGALIWIYNLTGASYAYGDFAVDEGTGISYIGEGKTGPTIVHKVNSFGIEIGLSLGDPNMVEIWRMVFNRVTNQILLAGGSGTNFAGILDTNLTHFSVPFGNFNDMTLLGVDNCPNTNNAYFATCCNNLLSGLPASTLSPAFFNVPDGYTFIETGSVTYVGGSNYAANGFNGIAVSMNFLYTYDGAILKKWDKATGAFITSLVISGTPHLQGGLDVDECDNIYVGNNSSISVYDVNLSLITTFALPNVIYDLKLDKANLLYACGLGFTTSIDLPNPLNNPITLTQTPVTLCNACNGTASVTVGNLCSNTTYLWSPGGQTTTTATGLCVGTYTVTAITGCNKILTDTISVLGNIAPLFLTSTQVDPLCNGNTNGTATANPSGGNGPYTYVWSPGGQTTQTITGLGAGSYSCTVTDANGCTLTVTVTIIQPSVISAPITFVNTSCGNNNGSATVTATGGTGTLNYSWAPSGGSNANATGLSPGTYTVYITDANGCSQTATTTVGPSTNPVLTLQSQVDVVCNGASTGTAMVSVTGGNGPYNWVWSPSGGTTANATGLGANTYTCTVTDASGCTATQIVTITEPTAISINTSSTQTNCTGSIGTATANSSGGNPGYTYSWNNGQTDALATGLGAGTYTVYVTDASGCTQTQTVTVTANNPVTLTTTSTQSSCLAPDGTATANPANGTSPYVYSWSDGQTNSVATGLAGGTYTVTVTDANGCSQTQTVVVPQQSGPTATAGASNTTIILGGTSQLGSTGGGTYSWAPAEGLSCTTCANPVATPIQTTTYCVYVTDVNGCTDVACVTIVVELPCVLATLEKLLPNAFSPNGDMNNDEYCVPENACIESFLLKVYDRWGEKVFETDSLEKCWDGIYRGMVLNTDVFAFYFDAKLTTGDNFSMKGNISLVR